MSNVNGSHTDDDVFSVHTPLYNLTSIKGKKQALADAYNRRLKAKHTLYCITDETNHLFRYYELLFESTVVAPK